MFFNHVSSHEYVQWRINRITDNVVALQSVANGGYLDCGNMDNGKVTKIILNYF
jgi:hypothetical protein